MSPMHKSITALAASALLATVGFATAQSTQATDANGATAQTTDANGATTTTTTTVDTTTQVLPAQPTGVIELAKPKNTVTPTTKQADGPLGMENNLMTTGVINGIVRPSIGDHATPPIQPDDQTIAVTKETTTTTTVVPPAPQPAAAPVAEPTPAPAAEPAPEPMPAPRADRN